MQRAEVLAVPPSARYVLPHNVDSASVMQWPVGEHIEVAGVPSGSSLTGIEIQCVSNAKQV